AREPVTAASDSLVDAAGPGIVSRPCLRRISAIAFQHRGEIVASDARALGIAVVPRRPNSKARIGVGARHDLHLALGAGRRGDEAASGIALAVSRFAL